MESKGSSNGRRSPGIQRAVETPRAIQSSGPHKQKQTGLRDDDHLHDETAVQAAESQTELGPGESRFRLLADSVDALIRVTGPDDRCTYVNRAWLAFTGRTGDQELNSGWQTGLHPQDRDRCLSQYQSARARQEPLVFDYRLRRFDGVYRLLRDSSMPLHLPDGGFQGYVASCIEIAEQDQPLPAVDAHQYQGQWLESLLDLLPMPMVLLDTATGSVTFSNRSACQKLDLFAGAPRSDNRCYTLRDTRGKTLDEHQVPLARVARGERLTDLEIEVADPDDRRSLIVHSAFLPGVDHRPPVAVVVYQDITDQKRIESDLRRINQAKDSLLAMLGHELRNPLAAITGAAELVELLEPTDPEFDIAREILQKQLQHLVQLVDDMLDMSRLTKGKIRIRRDPLDLRDVIHQSLQSCQGAIDERGHTLAVDLPDEPLNVEGDAARLEQVVVNLLTNAAKYTEPGGRIAVTAEGTSSECLLRVQDNGIGIDSHLLPQVFELFRQLSPSIHRSEGGLGIGLNIVKNLVELHGGSVAARSEGPGRGSEFTVRLPRRIVERPMLSAVNQVDQDDFQALAPLRVMVVEDNVDIACAMVALVKHLGHRVQHAHDGKQALAAAPEFAPHIALIDIGLPGVSGLELATAFRRDARLQTTYLVALTGFGQEEDRRRSLSAGFDQHLVKPLGLDRLKGLLQSVPRPGAGSDN